MPEAGALHAKVVQLAMPYLATAKCMAWKGLHTDSQDYTFWPGGPIFVCKALLLILGR